MLTCYIETVLLPFCYRHLKDETTYQNRLNFRRQQLIRGGSADGYVQLFILIWYKEHFEQATRFKKHSIWYIMFNLILLIYLFQ